MSVKSTSRSSGAISADIEALQTKLGEEKQKLQTLEHTEGTDYQSLLRSNATDTAVLDQIAKTQAQINILERGLVAAQADLAAAKEHELIGLRQAARKALAVEIDTCRNWAKNAQVHIDGLCAALLELRTRQKDMSERLTQVSRELAVPRHGVLILESRESLISEGAMRNQVLLAIFRQCSFIRPEFVQPGTVRPFDEMSERTFMQLASDMDELLGMTSDNDAPAVDLFHG